MDLWYSIKCWFNNERKANLLKIMVGSYNLTDDCGFYGKYRVLNGRIKKKRLPNFGKAPYFLIIPVTREVRIKYTRIDGPSTFTPGKVYATYVRLFKKRSGTKKILCL